MCGFFNHDEVLDIQSQFVGEGVKNISIDDSLTITNMTTEWGALAGVFEVDEVTINWLRKRNEFINKRELENVASDVDGRGKHPQISQERINDLV